MFKAYGLLKAYRFRGFEVWGFYGLGLGAKPQLEVQGCYYSVKAVRIITEV